MLRKKRRRKLSPLAVGIVIALSLLVLLRFLKPLRELYSHPRYENPEIQNSISTTYPSRHGSGRPEGSDFWRWFSSVDYDVYDKRRVLDDRLAIWDTIGGSLGQDGRTADYNNICATQISYALNRSGYPIGRSSKEYRWYNDPKSVDKFNGAHGDGFRYILAARRMHRYLLQAFGAPDFKNHGVYGVDNGSPQFISSLGLGAGTAIFASDGHVGVIKSGYKDPYLSQQGMVDIWKLPG